MAETRLSMTIRKVDVLTVGFLATITADFISKIELKIINPYIAVSDMGALKNPTMPYVTTRSAEQVNMTYFVVLSSSCLLANALGDNLHKETCNCSTNYFFQFPNRQVHSDNGVCIISHLHIFCVIKVNNFV
jgi:hypothetical protein